MSQSTRAHDFTAGARTYAVVKIVFAAFLGLHALIHLLGAAKGLGFADVAQLAQRKRPAITLFLMDASRAGEINPHTVSASFTNGSHTVSAVLSFNDHGELMDFAADGRGAASADGKSFTRVRWSTPLSDYRQFGPHRLMERGEGIWHAPSGDYSYLRFVLDSIEYNVAALPSGRH